jgi:hypothetical protein
MGTRAVNSMDEMACLFHELAAIQHWNAEYRKMRFPDTVEKEAFRMRHIRYTEILARLQLLVFQIRSAPIRSIAHCHIGGS